MKRAPGAKQERVVIFGGVPVIQRYLSFQNGRIFLFGQKRPLLGFGEFNYKKGRAEKRHHVLRSLRPRRVDDDFSSRAKKKSTCLDDGDANPKPLDRDRDTRMPGLEEQSSRTHTCFLLGTNFYQFLPKKKGKNPTSLFVPPLRHFILFCVWSPLPPPLRPPPPPLARAATPP